jgi:hypothetical protein
MVALLSAYEKIVSTPFPAVSSSGPDRRLTVPVDAAEIFVSYY